MSKDDAITSIPEIDSQSGYSSGMMIQLRMAPETGTKNFQVFSSDTFTPGRCSKPNQIVKAAADRKLSHPKATKYSIDTAFKPYPSMGIEIKINPIPPNRSDVELNTTGERPAGFLATNTFEKPDTKLFDSKNNTPSKLI